MSDLALTIRQQEAIALIASGRTQEDTAAILGISMRTLRRYLASNEVAAELRAAYRERLSALLRASLTAAPEALRTLHQVAADRAAPEHARVSASRAILEHSLRLYEAADLDARLDELERRLDDQEAPP
ncbi:MAG: helix-turn-helix domain-containing protein [Dehalococcoidia bacterium]